ncbi:MAG TPA: hypothetical protein VKU19_12355 [Bryobacteraceae bacterium]|nr:hypothetical protein [Bryobacteraceae bacterium]
MKDHRLIRAALLLGVAGFTAVHASDYVGIYARIDKVVLEPNRETPERIQVWGIFSLAVGPHGGEYAPPARGYLYLSLAGNPQAARAEWKDLQQVAGTGQIVAFGMRGQQPTLRKADDPPKNPDPYATNTGVVKVGAKSEYPPVKALLAFKE